MSQASILARLIREEHAQDLVEYAFLAAFLATAGYLTLLTLSGDVFTTYSTWIDPATGMPTLWEPAAPMTSGS